jgi:uncharacterized protein (DUF58 family)
VTIWDPEILARAASLQLKARSLVWGYRHGPHRTPQAARSVEFVGHKQYAAGDSLRDIDWKVMARRDQLLVKRQQAETDLAAMILIDASGDMATADGRPPPLEGSKFGRALTLAASLSMLLLRRGERVGLCILGGDGNSLSWLKPRSGSSQGSQILVQLAATVPNGEAHLNRGMKLVAERLPSRSMVFIISDLMEEPSEWGPHLRALGARKMDIRLAHLYSKKEWEMEVQDSVQLYSFEGGADIAVEPADLRSAFGAVVDEYCREVREWVSFCRGVHVMDALEDDLSLSFVRLLRGI